MSLPGVYRAKVVSPFNAGQCVVQIPQVFGKAQVTVTSFSGATLPLNLEWGWVAFEGGVAEFPVWMGSDTPVVI
jgi:hypothetical protein